MFNLTNIRLLCCYVEQENQFYACIKHLGSKLSQKHLSRLTLHLYLIKEAIITRATDEEKNLEGI